MFYMCSFYFMDVFVWGVVVVVYFYVFDFGCFQYFGGVSSYVFVYCQFVGMYGYVYCQYWQFLFVFVCLVQMDCVVVVWQYFVEFGYVDVLVIWYGQGFFQICIDVQFGDFV